MLNSTASVNAPNISINEVLCSAEKIILGKSQQLKLAVCCLLAGGHILIEDQPGVGKTTMAHTLSRVLGLAFNRVQFTSDMLPADILGVSIYDQKEQVFRFHRGPIFCQLLLADEINRATPKAQSALLEAMEERQVTADGESLKLPPPFFVIATQNPQNQIGTYALPESQLDRFLMRISIGYPDQQAERNLLQGKDRRILLDEITTNIGPNDLLYWQDEVSNIHCSDALLDYVQLLLQYTRDSNHWQVGLSPRAGLGLLQAARAWAFLDSRKQVLPEDIQTVLPAVANHRLSSNDVSKETISMQQLIESVPIP